MSNNPGCSTKLSKKNKEDLSGGGEKAAIDVFATDGVPPGLAEGVAVNIGVVVAVTCEVTGGGTTAVEAAGV